MMDLICQRNINKKLAFSVQNGLQFFPVWFAKSMVWSALPATGVQLRTVLTHSQTAHMPQATMCSPVAKSQQVAKLACIMLRNVTPGWI